MDCTRCQSYKDTNGYGGPACLRCKQYKGWQIKSVKRQSIRYEIIPQAILEQIEDLTKEANMLEVLRKLPLELSVPVVMYWILGATQQEIADYHGISRQAVAKKNSQASELIKKTLQ